MLVIAKRLIGVRPRAGGALPLVAGEVALLAGGHYTSVGVDHAGRLEDQLDTRASRILGRNWDRSPREAGRLTRRILARFAIARSRIAGTTSERTQQHAQQTRKG